MHAHTTQVGISNSVPKLIKKFIKGGCYEA